MKAMKMMVRVRVIMQMMMVVMVMMTTIREMVRVMREIVRMMMMGQTKLKNRQKRKQKDVCC